MGTGDASVLVEYFGEHSMVRIVDFLVENKLFDFSKKQIMGEVSISKATLFKYFPKLEEAGIVKASRRFGKAKLYRMNMGSHVGEENNRFGASVG
ncbi:MAG: winged helix-turn-helix transcriptional regulator [Candidatus Brockarchaeota archaeon]|nr:winged helix-turn-helix transcriptional regulator [Candidatus Brockarchaeota archaeon]